MEKKGKNGENLQGGKKNLACGSGNGPIDKGM